MNPERALNEIEANNIRLIRFLYCDPSGVIRGKTAHASQMKNKIVEGVGLTRAQHAINLFEDLVSIPNMEPVGEVRVIPDPDTYTQLPWLDRTASMFCDIKELDGAAWGGCTRSVLKRAIAYAESLGIEVKAAFESEFYLAEKSADGPVPWQNGPVYSSAGMDRVATVMDAMVDNLTDQGIVVEQAINEYGPGQQEIAIKYDEALRAADLHLKFRDTIRGTAEVQFGLLASLAPKPFADGIGSGAHLHFSLWSSESQTNLLYNPNSPQELSEFGKHFVAGVLEHLPALVALTCPSFVSYHRLKPHSWAGNTISWGYDNRECAVRVASPFKGREMQSINLELKACDGSNNPYLSLAGLIVAGLDGVARKLEAPAPAHRDPVYLTEAERVACNIRPLPASQLEALEALENDVIITEVLGELMTSAILLSRRAENKTAAEKGDDWARLQTFSTF
ncbi:MAG: glutamine synthetase family protein [Actinomycetes bacterium]